MLNNKLNLFYDEVRRCASEVGNSPTKITDKIISEVFPETTRHAEQEGADRMLRTGVIAEVRRLITSRGFETKNGHFAEVAPGAGFGHITSKLHRGSYLVPSLGEYLPIEALIAELDYLDEARKALRKHGEDTITEADWLDQLYREAKALRAGH